MRHYGEGRVLLRRARPGSAALTVAAEDNLGRMTLSHRPALTISRHSPMHFLVGKKRGRTCLPRQLLVGSVSCVSCKRNCPLQCMCACVCVCCGRALFGGYYAGVVCT